MNAVQPLAILIGALGGEGGGVLAGWLTRAAEIGGFPVQRTSIPGVAQRTGATTYYVEMLPVPRARLDDAEPALALSPVPGQIDLMVASELLEAARAAQGGLLDPQRTVLIASSHRVYTVAEKMVPSDGRFDDAALRRTLESLARRTILFDMDAAARAAGTAISAVMLGAIAGSGVLPLPRAAFEEAIRDSEKGVEANLAGFAAGFAAADASTPVTTRAQTSHGRTESPPDSATAHFVPEVQSLVEQGYRRQLDYQNRRYAELYLERVARVQAAEREAGAAPGLPVTTAVARFLALWMSYEDVIRVADLKSRAARFERIRAETGATDADIVRVTDYMKPGIEEWCAVLPAAVARRLREWAQRRGRTLALALRVRTDSVFGLLLLRALAALRPWRPYTLRYAEEQALIERWLGEVVAALPRDPALALEIAQCARLIKGYSDTHARGKERFLRILDGLRAPPDDAARREAVRAAREAALAEPPSAGAPVAAPVVWHQRPRRRAGG